MVNCIVDLQEIYFNIFQNLHIPHLSVLISGSFWPCYLFLFPCEQRKASDRLRSETWWVSASQVDSVIHSLQVKWLNKIKVLLSWSVSVLFFIFVHLLSFFVFLWGFFLFCFLLVSWDFLSLSAFHLLLLSLSKFSVPHIHQFTLDISFRTTSSILTSFSLSTFFLVILFLTPIIITPSFSPLLLRHRYM